MAEKVDLFNPNDGLVGRDGGPYLDQVEAEEAEKRRARIEGREPDLKNPGPTAGIPLVTAARLVETHTRLNVPSRDNTEVYDDAAAKIASSKNVAAEPVVTLDKAEIEKAGKAAEAQQKKKEESSSK